MRSILSSSTIRQRAKKGSIYTGPLMPTSVCHTKYSFGRHQVEINGPTKTDKYLTTEKYEGMIQIHTHTHPFNGSLYGTTRVSRYQKGKTNLDFTEAKDSEWQ